MTERNSIKESGILEQYVMGELSREERSKVDAILKEDEQLKAYVRAIENDLENVAFENAIEPPAHTKKVVLAAIKQKTNENEADPKVVPISEKKNSSRFFYVAASLAVLFLLSSGWLYVQWQNAQQSLQLVQQETVDLKNKIFTLQDNLKIVNTNYQLINQPNTIPLVLKGNELLPDARAITYINHDTKTVILTTRELPILPDDQTYQLWSDVEGEMINMGIVSLDTELLSMKYIDHAESINLTIEPAGGSEHPTVERLVSNVLL